MAKWAVWGTHQSQTTLWRAAWLHLYGVAACTVSSMLPRARASQALGTTHAPRTRRARCLSLACGPGPRASDPRASLTALAARGEACAHRRYARVCCQIVVHLGASSATALSSGGVPSRAMSPFCCPGGGGGGHIRRYACQCGSVRGRPCHRCAAPSRGPCGGTRSHGLSGSELHGAHRCHRAAHGFPRTA